MTTRSTFSVYTVSAGCGEPSRLVSIAEKAVNAAGADGLLFGGMHQFLVQAVLVGVTAVFAAIMTWILFKVIDGLIGMRVEKKDELIGLDLTQHNEVAYTVIE